MGGRFMGGPLKVLRRAADPSGGGDRHLEIKTHDEQASIPRTNPS